VISGDVFPRGIDFVGRSATCHFVVHKAEDASEERTNLVSISTTMQNVRRKPSAKRLSGKRSSLISSNFTLLGLIGIFLLALAFIPPSLGAKTHRESHDTKPRPGTAIGIGLFSGVTDPLIGSLLILYRSRVTIVWLYCFCLLKYISLLVQLILALGSSPECVVIFTG
jgi:hypothetical protein